jgi:hypothetical protein
MSRKAAGTVRNLLSTAKVTGRWRDGGEVRRLWMNRVEAVDEQGIEGG